LRVPRLLIAALLLVGACTGSATKKSTPNDFVDAACADLSGFATAVDRAFKDLQSLSQIDVTDTVGTQAFLVRLSTSLREADTATTQLANGISSRGAPNIASGDDIKKAILDSLNRLREGLGKTRNAIDAFDFKTATTDESAKLRAEIDSLTTTGAEAIAGLAPLNENNELRAAFAGSATCRQVGSQLSSGP
jgi:hypothetical protein